MYDNFCISPIFQENKSSDIFKLAISKIRHQKYIQLYRSVGKPLLSPVCEKFEKGESFLAIIFIKNAHKQTNRKLHIILICECKRNDIT